MENIMAQFEPAFEKMIRNEGGYQLHKVEGDRGGMTYAGISRRYHPHWPGWELIDSDRMDPRLTESVREFYRGQFWEPIQGDDIETQEVAESLFDFAVNAGISTAVKLAQVATGTTPDGIFGPKTLEALNSIDPAAFIGKYVIAKMARYAEICNRDSSQKKFLLGWINRTLKGVS